MADPLAADALTAVRAVLFDMDGTLVDSNTAVENSWSAWAREHDVPEQDVIAACHGQLPGTTMRQFRPDLTDEQVAAATATLLERECTDLESVRAMPGAAALLTWLDDHDLPWTVVTNATRQLAQNRLGAAGITTDLLVPVDEIEHGKPDPEGYLTGAEQVGVPIGECLVVEDSPSGLRAGRDAGAITATVGGLTGADVVCRDLPDLLSRLQSARATDR